MIFMKALGKGSGSPKVGNEAYGGVQSDDESWRLYSRELMDVWLKQWNF